MFVRSENPIWFFNNLIGQPLDDTYYAFFCVNVFPYISQAVYKDPNGNAAWPFPIQFSPAGALPDNLYFNPDQVYRIEIRQGNTQSDPLIWLIEDYVPGTGLAPSDETALTSTNMITNPQFADVYFGIPSGATKPTLTLTAAGTYDIAPGWKIVLTGTGTATLVQDTIAGSNDVAGNPPYDLSITSSFSTCQLVQRFSNNGAIFSGGGVAVAFTAMATSSPQTISVEYLPSFTLTGAVQLFPNGLIPIATGSFIQYAGGNNIDPPSTNTDEGEAAYVDIVFNLSSGPIRISNVQITGQSIPFPVAPLPVNDAPLFQEQTYNRTLDQEFNVYKDPLFYKQIPSYLVGWDFPLNPAQFTSGRGMAAQAVGAGKSYYAWDQTILWQSVDSGITVSSGVANDLQLTAASTGQMAIIQYLTATEAKKILNDVISVNLSAISSNGTTPVTISLWYTKGNPLPSVVGSNLSIILTLDANGYPSGFNQPTGGNWIPVTPLNGEQAFCIVKGSSTTNFNDYSFNGYWEIAVNADANLATYFAIVIGTGSITAADYLRINSVGLCSGKIATRPSPQTQDEVLRECQYYYEKSFNPGVLPGTATLDNIKYQVPNVARSGGGDLFAYLPSFAVEYSTKNIVPVITFYSGISTTATNVQLSILDEGTAVAGPSEFGVPASYAAPNIQINRASYTANGGFGLGPVSVNPLYREGVMKYHFVADSRIAQ